MPHSQVHNDQTVPIIMADFSVRRENFGDLAINKGYIAYFSLRMRETAVFPLPV